MLRRGPFIALNDEVIRPWSESDQNWDTKGIRRRFRSYGGQIRRLVEPVFVYEWMGSGRNAVNSGPSRCFDIRTTRPAGRLRSGRISTEPVWLFGWKTHN